MRLTLYRQDDIALPPKEDRQQQILETVQSNRQVIVPELSGHFSVSEVTIRRDLRELADQRIVRRAHGGGGRSGPGIFHHRLRCLEPGWPPGSGRQGGYTVAAGTRFHITPYLRRQMNDHPPRLGFSATDRAGWEQWRRQLRQKLYDLLAPWPQPIPLVPEIVQVSEERDHWREEIVLSSHSNLELPGYLLRPKAGEWPRPAVLALHGHGPGKDQTVGLIESEIDQGYGLQMVRAGHVVFTLDFFPFGSRKETDHNAQEGFEYACNSTLIRALLWGYNLLTLNLFDVFRSLDYLESRPEVDPKRIGVMGCSYGGTTSMYVAILDQRIRAVVLSCSLGEYRGHGIELDELCGVQVVPGILQWAEMGDVAGLLAPMPLFVESAREDACFPWQYTEPTLERLRQVYRVARADDQLTIEVHDDQHRYYGDGVLEFWDRYL